MCDKNLTGYKPIERHKHVFKADIIPRCKYDGRISKTLL